MQGISPECRSSGAAFCNRIEVGNMRKNTDREPSAQGRRRWHVSAEEWAHTLEVRKGLWQCGYTTIPCDEEGKKPLFANWPQFQYNPDDPEPAIPRTINRAGHPTKAPHLGTGASTYPLVTFDMDFDSADDDQGEAAAAVEDAREVIERIAGPAPLVRYRDDSPRKMLIYGAAPGQWSIANDGLVKTDFGNIGCDANHHGQFVHGTGLGT